MAVALSTGKIVALVVAFTISVTVVGVGCWYGALNQQTTSTSDFLPGAAPSTSDFLPGAAPWLNLYLPSYTTPKHYNLTLHPDFYDDQTTFYGNVTIEIDVRQATWHLLVHIKRLDVQVTSIVNKETNEDYGVEKEWGYEPNQFWIAKTKKMIEESATVLLTIKFSGSLTDGIVGLYKAVYANNTKSMATSKFEPVDARKAFPCFDEPNLKATFTTTLIHKPDFVALSNMPVETTKVRSDGLQVTQFVKSVPMSTYLACFIVCKCRYKELDLQSGKKFRVYAVEGSEDQVDYALELGANITDFFEGYFGLDYPLPKMDMIAIPDFVSGAMEHWGLITYRETNLLYKEGVSSASNKQRIAEVVAHELAHQWFGNIVTMDWWDDLWLNEGFATFMSYVGTEPFEPQMEVTNQFAAVEAFTVMPEDSVASSHPIIVPVKRPEDITAVFDSISYNKGASVIRMLESFVGADVFKTALEAYLKRYQYENAKTHHLWSSINEKVDQWDIELIMDTWTKQSGFPLINISYDSQTKNITATQALYRDKNNDAEWPKSDYNYLWEVPLHYVSSDGASGDNFEWIHSTESQATFTSPVDPTQDNKWLKFNKGTTGYYKVNYPTDWWKKLELLLKNDTQVMDVGDRAGLINDAVTLPTYGHLPYSTGLDFISYMTEEKHYVAWISVNSELFTIRNWLDSDKWKMFVQELVKNTYDELSWNNNGTHLDKLLRGTIIRLACGHEYSQCLTQAKEIFTQWLADPQNNPMDATLRREVLLYGMRDVSVQEWDKVWTLYNVEPVASAKADMRLGLAKTTDPTLINKYLGYAMNKDKVADQDFFSVISYLSGNDVALPIVWEFVKQRYNEIKERFGIDSRYFGRMVPGIANGFTTADRLAEVEAFYVQEPEEGSGKRAREQSLEAIRMAMAWKDRYANDVTQWLDARS